MAGRNWADIYIKDGLHNDLSVSFQNHQQQQLEVGLLCVGAFVVAVGQFESHQTFIPLLWLLEQLPA